MDKGSRHTSCLQSEAPGAQQHRKLRRKGASVSTAELDLAQTTQFPWPSTQHERKGGGAGGVSADKVRYSRKVWLCPDRKEVVHSASISTCKSRVRGECYCSSTGPHRARHPLDVLGALVADEDDNGVDVHMVQPLYGVRCDVQKTVPVLRDNGTIST